MEPVLTLTYYAQLREQMHSWTSHPSQSERAAVSVRTPTNLVCTQAKPQSTTNANFQSSAAGGDGESPEVSDLNEAFEAITEKMNFHWPRSSPNHRIKAGLIESILGLLLFVGLILLVESLWH
jgi:hypothetical protein